MVVQKINSKKKSTYENDNIKNTNHCSGDEGIDIIVVKLQVFNQNWFKCVNNTSDFYCNFGTHLLILCHNNFYLGQNVLDPCYT